MQIECLGLERIRLYLCHVCHDVVSERPIWDGGKIGTLPHNLSAEFCRHLPLALLPADLRVPSTAAPEELQILPSARTVVKP